MTRARHDIDRRVLGTICLVPAVASLPPLLVAALAGSPDVAWGFAVTAVASLALALCLRRVSGSGISDTGTLLATMGLAWLVVPLLAAPPYLAAWLDAPSHDDPVVDALFEAVSSFTSCGLTMSSDPSALSPGLQLWRSLGQWIGGVGIAALMLLVTRPGLGTLRLLSTEVGDVRGDAARADRWIWGVYAGLTAAALATFLALDVPPWEALNHALTSVSTGGFTVRQDSLASSAPAVRVAAGLFVLVGAVSFTSLRREVSEHDPRRFPVRRVAGVLCGLGAAVLAVRALGDATWGDAAFQSASALATGGYSTASLSDWSTRARAVLVAAMLVGGMAGSTAGGLKIQRVVVLARAVLPGRGREDRERVAGALRITAAFLLAVAAATAVVTAIEAPRVDADAVLFDVVSAVSTVGLSAGVANEDAAVATKLVLVVLMWLGRLEFVAAAVLLRRLVRPRSGDEG